MSKRPVASAHERWLGYHRVLEARSPSTPAAVLSALAQDGLPAVRLEVARNGSTPPSALGQLVTDGNSMVRWYALRNPVTDGSALAAVAAGEAGAYGDLRLWVRSLIVHHPNLPVASVAAAVAAGACGCPGECYSKKVFG